MLIRADGLRPMGRHHVHLSVDRATAVAVGRRKAARPVVLRVAAGPARAAGIAFYRGSARVRLADATPARFVGG